MCCSPGCSLSLPVMSTEGVVGAEGGLFVIAHFTTPFPERLLSCACAAGDLGGQHPGRRHNFRAHLLLSTLIARLPPLSMSLRSPTGALLVRVGAHPQAAFLCLPHKVLPKKKEPLRQHWVVFEKEI